MEDNVFERWNEFLEERVSAMQSSSIEDYAEEVNYIIDVLQKEAKGFLSRNDSGHLLMLRHGLRNVLRALRNKEDDNDV